MDFDAIVVGAGIMGAATARALARSGRAVLVLERFRIGHDRGSSHGRARIFRLSYPDPAYVSMAQEALGLWRELEEDAGTRVLTTTGGLDAGGGISANAAALEQCGIAFETFDGRRANERFPVSLPPDEPALFQADGGIVAADAALAAFVSSARAAGADVREESAVVALEPLDDRVAVATEAERFEAPVAVVTAGAWANDVLATAGIELPVRVTRETVAYFETQHESVPTVVEWGEPAVYALPSPGQGIKVGEHIAGPTIHPDGEGQVDEGSVATLTRWMNARFPGAEPRPHRAETCLYTNTEDQAFILERRGPIVVGSPCSGHGFKFAPLIGRRLARLALDA